jgi:signal peptidase I
MPVLRALFTFLTDIVQTILIAASVFVVIYVFLFRPFQVSGASMFPNFVDKEYVLTNLIVYRLQSPDTGDIVVFQSPVDKEKDFIKRIIATEGDTISVSNGQVYLNKNLLDESAYLKPEVKTYGGAFLREGQEVVVPEGKYFVLGDNRSYSSDSREWGFVTRGEIIGRSMFVYWPISNARAVSSN